MPRSRARRSDRPRQRRAGVPAPVIAITRTDSVGRQLLDQLGQLLQRLQRQRVLVPAQHQHREPVRRTSSTSVGPAARSPRPAPSGRRTRGPAPPPARPWTSAGSRRCRARGPGRAARTSGMALARHRPRSRSMSPCRRWRTGGSNPRSAPGCSASRARSSACGRRRRCSARRAAGRRWRCRWPTTIISPRTRSSMPKICSMSVIPYSAGLVDLGAAHRPQLALDLAAQAAQRGRRDDPAQRAADADRQMVVGAAHGGVDGGRDVAVGDQLDARAGVADLGHQVVVPRPVEHDRRDVGHRPPERVGDRLRLSRTAQAQVDAAAGDRADRHLLHVHARQRRQAARIARGQDRQRAQPGREPAPARPPPGRPPAPARGRRCPPWRPTVSGCASSLAADHHLAADRQVVQGIDHRPRGRLVGASRASPRPR